MCTITQALKGLPSEIQLITGSPGGRHAHQLTLDGHTFKELTKRQNLGCNDSLGLGYLDAYRNPLAR